MKADSSTVFADLQSEFLELMLRNSPFGFSLIDENGTINFVNDAWLHIMQVGRDQVVSKNVFDVFTNSEAEFRSIFDEIKVTGQPFYASEHKVLLKRNGALREAFFNLVLQPLHKEEGAFCYFGTAIVEVTDIVRTKNLLTEQEERLRLATESTQTGTWDLNLITSEIVHSPFLADIFGYPSHHKLTHSEMRAHLIESDRVEIVEKAFNEALESGIYHYEARIRDTHGTIKWIATHGRIFYNTDGVPTRMLGVMQDISQRKRNEQLIERSHHQLKTAMEATRLGRFDMDFHTQEKYNFCPRFMEIFGYDPATEQIDGHVLEQHIDPDFLEVRTEALREAKRSGNLYYQSKINLRDGSSRWIEMYGRLLQTGTEKAVVSGTIRDITEHKEYEFKISESEKNYRFLADAMPQIVWIGDSTGRLIYFNQSTMDYSGKDYNTFLEPNGWLDIVHPDEREENLMLWKKSIETGRAFHFEHRFRSKTGEYHWFLSRAFPDRAEDGTIRRWVGTSTDIDEMKKQEKQKNDFIKMANHELKTPVTTIKGYVQLLKKMRGNSEDQFLVNSLNTIEGQVNKLNGLIGDLLDITRMESGTLPLKKTAFPLQELVTETIKDILATGPAHQINFNNKKNSALIVYADRDRITQVLNNLLTNAIKYSPGTERVEVGLQENLGRAVISVRDYGIGMNADELTRIFERFYRVLGDDEQTYPGFGIGLYIVKDIMDRHGGQVWAESTKNEGSTFYLALPLIREK